MAFSFFTDLLSKRPKVPDWQTINPSTVQQQTVQGNLASFANAKALADQYNQFQQSQVLQQLRTAVPEFAPLQGQMAANLSAQLRGELTQSDLANAQRMGSARALGLGLAGSQAGAAFNAYNVGKLQAQVQQGAQAQTPAWLQTAAGITRAPTFDFSSVFLSPVQRFQMQLQNQEAQWNRDWLANQVSSVPSGVGAAFAKLGDWSTNAAAQAALSYFGGGIGMGGGSNPNSQAIANNLL